VKGRARAPVFCAAYLIKSEGLTSDESLDHVSKCLDRGSNLEMTEVKEFLRQLDMWSGVHSVGRLFCEECFAEHREGRPDGALSVRLVDATKRIRCDDEALTVLDLAALDVDASGTEPLCTALCANSCLRVLSLSGNPLGDGRDVALPLAGALGRNHAVISRSPAGGVEN